MQHTSDKSKLFCLRPQFYSIPSDHGISVTSAFPEPYRTNGTVFIAEHGSWNRQSAIGYRIGQVDVSPAPCCSAIL